MIRIHHVAQWRGVVRGQGALDPGQPDKASLAADRNVRGRHETMSGQAGANRTDGRCGVAYWHRAVRRRRLETEIAGLRVSKRVHLRTHRAGVLATQALCASTGASAAENSMYAAHAFGAYTLAVPPSMSSATASTSATSSKVAPALAAALAW